VRRTIGIVALVVAVVVAGCSSSSSPTSAPFGGSANGGDGGGSGASQPPISPATTGNAPDACTLLARDEIQAAVGPVMDGTPDVLNSCKWEKADPTGISVALHLLALQNAKCAVGHAGSTPVEGLSVPASWEFVDAATTGSVLACTGGWQVQVTLVGDIVGHTTPEATLRTDGTQLMSLVLGRM
jgi:hypothetical protein